MTIGNRLARLEQRAADSQAKSGMLVIFVEGGLPGPEHKTASAAGHEWLQWPNETNAEFEARARRLAQEAGGKTLVIGGLPGVCAAS